MKTEVEFRSAAFPPYEDEELEVNPGRFGKRLAEFLYSRLKDKGFEPLEPVNMDWGWLVPIKNGDFPLSIGCGNCGEYLDGFLVFIRPHQPMIRRFLFWKIDTTAQVTALQMAIDQLLSGHPLIRDIHWWAVDKSLRRIE